MKFNIDVIEPKSKLTNDIKLSFIFFTSFISYPLKGHENIFTTPELSPAIKIFSSLTNLITVKLQLTSVFITFFSFSDLELFDIICNNLFSGSMANNTFNTESYSKQETLFPFGLYVKIILK